MLRHLFYCCLFLAPICAPAQTLLDQRCDLQVSNLPICEALARLGKNCGVPMAYSEHFFPLGKKVTLRAEGWPMKKILRVLLANGEVGYREMDGQVIFFLQEKSPPRQLNLSGYVEDASTGERLIAAAIYCPLLNRGTVSNEYGFFSLHLPEGPHKVAVSYLGYHAQEQEISLSANQFLNVGLQPALTLAEVIVTPKMSSEGFLPSLTTGTQISADDTHAAPDLGGESDLLRIVQLLPGVTTGADGFGGINVRGGGSEQNLILLDGVPVYNPGHMLGILSIFNTSAVKNAKVLKGGIPARYGGRISSVIDVRTREGSSQNWGLEAGGDLLGMKGALEGPFAKGRGTVLLTGRWSYSDFLLGDVVKRTLLGDLSPVSDYYFFDLNGKLSYRFSDKDRFYLSAYRGRDRFEGGISQSVFVDEVSIDFSNKTDLSWGNSVASLRWNHVFGPRVFSNTTLTYSQYDFLNKTLTTYSATEEEFEEEVDFGFFTGFASKITDMSLRTDFEYALSQRHYFRFGAGLTPHVFNPRTETQGLDFINSGDLDSLDFAEFSFSRSDLFLGIEVDFYVEDEFKLGKKWHLNTGLRTSSFNSGTSYYTLEPRLSANYQAAKHLCLTASFDRTAQYMHRLSYSEINLPNDVWIPADSGSPPQRSWLGSIGASASLPAGLELSVEGFAKTIRNVKSLAYLSTISDGDGSVEEIEFIPNTKGHAYGVEFFLRKTGKRTGGWLSYTLSKSERTLLDSIPGLQFDFQYDRRHDAKVFLYHRLNDRWQLGLNWVFGTPMPRLYTRPDEDVFFPSSPVPLPLYPFRGPLRLTPYHRLDLSVAFLLKGKYLEHTLKLSVYNAYNRLNPVFYRYYYYGNKEVVNMLPVLPGVFYGVKF